MKAKPIDKLTKPELLKLCKRLHKRIERLEARVAAFEGVNEAQAEQLAEAYEAALAGELGVVHVTQEDGVGLSSMLHPDSIETAEIEIKHPSEQTGFKIVQRMPWETALPNGFEGNK